MPTATLKRYKHLSKMYNEGPWFAPHCRASVALCVCVCIC